MAGVRLGYCLCSDGETLDRIRAAGQPWSVSYLAEEAGIAALKQEGWVEGTREMIRVERNYLLRELAGLGVEEIFGEANYLLLRWPGREDFSEALRTRGILIRDCSNYHGLEKGWYRIAVRTREENRRLIEALKALGSE